MLRIAICDDDEKTVKELEATLKNYFSDKVLQTEIHTFSSGVLLLENYQPYDLLLLDIDMPKLDGIEAAKLIRKQDIGAKIIYITNHSDQALRAISVRVFGYIVKPFSAEGIRQELDSFLAFCNIENLKHRITFCGKGVEKSLYIEDVLYFEIAGKNTIDVYTLDSKDRLYSSLNDIYDKIKGYSFARIHQSFLVNMFYIKRIERFQIAMTNGAILPVAQKKFADFKKEHCEYVQSIQGRY